MTLTAEPTTRAGASPSPSPTTDPLSRPARRTARWRLVVCLTIVVGALGWVAVRGLTGSFVYYLTPTDISVAHKADVDQRVRLGGYVVPGSLHRGPSALRFVVSDGVSTMRVLSTGPVPQMFRAGQGVVLGRAEQPQRPPPGAPRVPELAGRLQHHEPDPVPAQVPGGGEAGLPAPDDDDVVRVGRGGHRVTAGSTVTPDAVLDDRVPAPS